MSATHPAPPPEPGLLDIRPVDAFLAGHHPAAAHIPLEELKQRIHELPPDGGRLALIDDDPARRSQALAFLAERDLAVAVADQAVLADRSAVGPPRVQLWRPHGLLIEALPHLDAQAGCTSGAWAPRHALDLACGSGRDAVWLALQGWRVAAWDRLPDALTRAADLAQRCGVAIEPWRVEFERADSEFTGSELAELELAGALLPAVGFDLVCVFYYLHRPLLPWLRRAVRPGGWLVYETFVEPQREQFGKPRRAEFELRRGELRAAFADWDVRIDREGPVAPRRIAAQFVARRNGQACNKSPFP